MFTGLEHLAIASPHPKQLAEWYVETLGFRINFEYDGNFFIRARDGGMIEIIPSQGERGEAQARTPGLRHLAISVGDFDAAYRHLQTLGIQFAGEPFVNQGNRLVFFNDLDGNLMHLIQREQPLP